MLTPKLSFSVRSFGTEDRPTDRPVAPRDEIYEYIIFRGSDIKDIRVCAAPKPQPTLEGGLPNDPAIVQVDNLMFWISKAYFFFRPCFEIVLIWYIKSYNFAHVSPGQI